MADDHGIVNRTALAAGGLASFRQRLLRRRRPTPRFCTNWDSTLAAWKSPAESAWILILANRCERSCEMRSFVHVVACLLRLILPHYCFSFPRK